jgi:hypothetical protein
MVPGTVRIRSWLRAYFYRTMREIYWDLGMDDVPEQVFDQFLSDWKFG